jgi:subtilisin family serine protease
MAKRNVIIELKYNRDLAASAFSAAPAVEKKLEKDTVPKIPGIKYDPDFAPVNLPGLQARTANHVPYISGAKFDLVLEPQESTYIVRAEVDENKIDDVKEAPEVVGVFSDVEIQPAIICPGSPPMGTNQDVANLLCVPQMQGISMDGLGVMIAIVDTGINLDYLSNQGVNLTLDVTRSWVPNPGMVPGSAPVSHGTMCAFDAAIAAPRATFLDVQVLRSTATGPTPMSGVLSDAVRAYGHLCGLMTAPRRPGDSRSLVVSNSWGMFHPTWDFPPGDPGNYSDNPNHPFNRIVATLESLGADILFAAGNCGADCPDGRCQGVTSNAIYGANSHPSVLCIAGVDISKTRVGYSTQGPGRLSQDKPDLCGYTHFRGSGVYAADGGTSAATPVVAGVVAAVRSKRPYEPGNPAASPAAVRALMRTTAEDLGTAGFDFNHGFGVVNGCALQQRFSQQQPVYDICQRIPWLCRPPFNLCQRFPRLCELLSTPTMQAGAEMSTMETKKLEELLLTLYQAGYNDSMNGSSEEDNWDDTEA